MDRAGTFEDSSIRPVHVPETGEKECIRESDHMKETLPMALLFNVRLHFEDAAPLARSTFCDLGAVSFVVSDLARPR